MRDEIKKYVDNYRNFLINSWSNIEKVYEDLDWDNLLDFSKQWKEINFYYLVNIHLETKLKCNIFPYGWTSYNYLNYEKKYMKNIFYRIVCVIDNKDYYFCEFVSIDNNGNIYEGIPFDYVKVESIDRKIIYFNYKFIKSFKLVKVEL